MRYVLPIPAESCLFGLRGDFDQPRQAMVTEPNFQQALYGSDYQKLYNIKQKWDSEGVFYAITAVGSED